MSTVEIGAKDVKALRERTGAGMMDCKKALTETGGDIEKAIEVLRVKQGKSHFRRNKSKASKGLFDETIPLNKADAQRIKRVLPYH